MAEIDKYISENKEVNALYECVSSNQNYLGLLLSKIWLYREDIHQTIIKNIEGFEQEDIEILEETSDFITVKLLCNWMTSEELAKSWNKMSQGNFTWNKIKVIWTYNKEPDYYVVINKPPSCITPPPEKTIVFRMEPYMEKHPEIWKEWTLPDITKFFKVCYHDTEYNNNEWHLSLTYNELMSKSIDKSIDDILSTVLSSKYSDIGHIKRIDFIKFLESKNMNVHVFGDNKFEYKNYKGALPPREKDKALFPYKYTFNAENNSIKNYYTEKLIDGILSETLVFYNGCPNIREYIDEKAFVWLELSNFENDYQTIKKAIEEDWWSKRIEYIRAEKIKILNQLQFFPRLERIIDGK